MVQSGGPTTAAVVRTTVATTAHASARALMTTTMGGGQGAGDKDDGNGDAKMMGNFLGINLIEQFFVEADNELKKAANGKQDY
jgi:hypothetical protein